MPAPTRTDAASWLTLLRAPGLGPLRGARLLERYGDPAAVLAAPRNALAELPAPAVEFLRAPPAEAIAADLHWLQGERNHLVTLHDAAYPAPLREIADAPLALFVIGDPGLLATPQLAVVGSRSPTAGGREAAQAFAAQLSAAGLTITSGLALGVDAEAHRGALSVGCPTLAVMGTGPDRVYPARHRSLAHEIAATGALVTEFPPGTPPLPEHFPRRNRLISGLSLGVLVVEAAPHSGSLITARLAAEQGREVYAIPGSIHNPLARGCHLLIRQGAKLVETAADVLEELPFRPCPRSLPDVDAPAPVPAQALDARQRAVLDAMRDGPVTVDRLVGRCALTPEVVSSILLGLEMRGLVAAEPGGRYLRVGSEVG